MGKVHIMLLSSFYSSFWMDFFLIFCEKNFVVHCTMYIEGYKRKIMSADPISESTMSTLDKFLLKIQSSEFSACTKRHPFLGLKTDLSFAKSLCHQNEITMIYNYRPHTEENP